MKKAKKFWTLMRSVAWRGFAVTIVAFFAGYALFGSNGVLAWGDYRQRLDTATVQLTVLKKQQAELANRVALLDPRHANPDLVDELVRRELGVAHPDEVIIPLR
jgi:cell division protein FtsB